MSWRYYDLFISHAWRYDHRYQGIVRLLDNSPRFYWRDYSRSKDRPVVAADERMTRRELTLRLDEQVRQCSCFIISASMELYHRRWVLTELEIARAYGKPLLAVRPLGQERIPRELDDAYLVGWRSQSLVGTIREISL